MPLSPPKAASASKSAVAVPLAEAARIRRANSKRVSSSGTSPLNRKVLTATSKADAITPGFSNCSLGRPMLCLSTPALTSAKPAQSFNPILYVPLSDVIVLRTMGLLYGHEWLRGFRAGSNLQTSSRFPRQARFDQIW